MRGAPIPARVLGEPRRVLLVAAALISFAAGVDVLHDPDLWWHLRLGRWILDNHQVPHAELFSFTAQGNHMVAHEWGSEVLFTWLSSAGGLLLVSLVMGLVAWSALLALGLRASARRAGPVAIALALLLGARAAEPVLGTRPQVITVALVCWTLLVAERHLVRGGRLVWVLPPVGLVWANLHGGVVLGLAALLGLVGLEGLRRVIRSRAADVASWRRIGEVLAATAGAAALGCLNPNGPSLYAYAVRTSSSERAKPITEWHSPDFHDPSNIGLLILLASFPLLIALGGRVNLRDLGMSAAGFAAALVSVRNTSLAVALALPAWAMLLQQVLDRFGVARPRLTPPRRSSVAFGALIVAAALAVDGVVVARAARDASSDGIASVYPACAADALHGVDGVRILAPYYHSGYLIDRLWPQGRVFLYGESVSLGSRVFDDYVRILDGGPAAMSLLQRYGANAVLIGPGGLHDTLAASPEWHAVLDDPMGATLFVTSPPAGGQPVIAPSGACPT